LAGLPENKSVGSEPVIELFKGQVAWDGVVEIFELIGHSKAKRCYAWSYLKNDEPQYTTVLEIPPREFSRDCRQSCDCGQSESLIKICGHEAYSRRSDFRSC
jgi:hypothetical protein